MYTLFESPKKYKRNKFAREFQRQFKKMAKTYRRRRYYRRKGKWSANIKTLTKSQISVTPGTFFGNTVLCSNPVQSDTTVSQQYTVKNVELSFEIEVSDQYHRVIEGLTSYIMFVPQGYVISETLPNTHPEWIMAYKFLGSPNEEYDANTGPYRNPLRVKTRLARRLQTGDSIVLLIVGNNPSNNTFNMEFDGIIRWWTKAN